jgi:TPR repeat protein
VSGGVFICYRREESAFAPRAIHDRVVQRLERQNVFLDFDNIDLGVDWFNVLTERVGACDVLVAVIGRNWISIADKDNQRRLDDADDFVRIEIEAALRRDVRVIPVLVDGAAVPKASELPDSLKGLARRQGIEISPARFDAGVEKLTRALVSILEARRSDVAEAEEAGRAEDERRAREAAEAERQERERQEAADAARAEDARRQAEAEAEAARQAEDERRAREAAESERAREERERQGSAEAVRAEGAREKAKAEVTRRAEEERGAKEAAEVERIADKGLNEPEIEAAWRAQEGRTRGAAVVEKATNKRRESEAVEARREMTSDRFKLSSRQNLLHAWGARWLSSNSAYSLVLTVIVGIAVAGALATFLAAKLFSFPLIMPTPTQTSTTTLRDHVDLAERRLSNGDYAGALDLYREAADQGSSAAQFAVGNFYRYGLGGIPLNTATAIGWYQKAAAQGDSNARAALNVLLK